MKPSRVWAPLIISILVSAFLMTTAQMDISLKENVYEQNHSVQKDQTDPSPYSPSDLNKKTVTVILHGLMVGQPKKINKKNRRFEVGIVKRADTHKFMLTQYVPGQGCTDIKIPGSIPRENPLIFEVTKAKVSIPRDIEMWSPSALQPDDLDPIQRIRYLLEDSKYILNIEEDIHNGRIGRFDKAHKRIFHFHNGKVKSYCLTKPLLKKKVDADDGTEWEPIDPIAEVVKIEVQVGKDEEMVLNDGKGNIIWSRAYNNITNGIEVRVLNLPGEHPKAKDCKGPYEGCITECREFVNLTLQELLYSSRAARLAANADDEDLPPTHFQFYYYLVFDKDRDDRYELKAQKDISGHDISGHDTCIRIVKTEGGPVIATVPPYKCGMVIVREGNDMRTR